MSRQSSLIPEIRKKPGPAPTGQGTPVMVRTPPDLLESLDAYIAATEPEMTRPEAIRRIVEFALKNHAERQAVIKESQL